jgi:hypothetical protein
MVNLAKLEYIKPNNFNIFYLNQRVLFKKKTFLELTSKNSPPKT